MQHIAQTNVKLMGQPPPMLTNEKTITEPEKQQNAVANEIELIYP